MTASKSKSNTHYPGRTEYTGIMQFKHVHNVELDAVLVLAGMRGGLHAVLGTAMRLGLSEPDEAIDRAAWLRKQSDDYITQVVNRVVELE